MFMRVLSVVAVARLLLVGSSILAWLLLATSSCFASPFAYAVDTRENLYSVDLGTSTKTLIGPTGLFLEGLALAPNGNLYGTSDAGGLYSINPTTGAATLIGSTGLGNIEGLDFNGNTLVAVNFLTPPSVYSVNLNTGTPSLIVTAGADTGTVRSMAVIDSNTILIRGDNPNNTLFKVNLTSGAVTTVGTMAGVNILAAMDFASDGNLYGLDLNGNEFLINPNTAGVSLVGNTGQDFWLDMAAIVPEPGTVLLLGVGLGCFWLLRRR